MVSISTLATGVWLLHPTVALPALLASARDVVGQGVKLGRRGKLDGNLHSDLELPENLEGQEYLDALNEFLEAETNPKIILPSGGLEKLEIFDNWEGIEADKGMGARLETPGLPKTSTSEAVNLASTIEWGYSPGARKADAVAQLASDQGRPVQPQFPGLTAAASEGRNCPVEARPRSRWSIFKPFQKSVL